jgi:hypothetical protein
MTSPVSSVRNFESMGLKDVRTAEKSAPIDIVSPPQR